MRQTRRRWLATCLAGSALGALAGCTGDDGDGATDGGGADAGDDGSSDDAGDGGGDAGSGDDGDGDDDADDADGGDGDDVGGPDDALETLSRGGTTVEIEGATARVTAFGDADLVAFDDWAGSGENRELTPAEPSAALPTGRYTVVAEEDPDDLVEWTELGWAQIGEETDLIDGNWGRHASETTNVAVGDDAVEQTTPDEEATFTVDLGSPPASGQLLVYPGPDSGGKLEFRFFQPADAPFYSYWGAASLFVIPADAIAIPDVEAGTDAVIEFTMPSGDRATAVGRIAMLAGETVTRVEPREE